MNEKGVYELMIEEGFAKIPKQAITNFKPRENHTETAYVTVLYYYEEDKKHCIAEDLPHGYRHAIIVTATGGIVDARSKNEPWVDINGVNHRCVDCHELSTLCTACLIDTRLEVIQKSISFAKHCQLAKALIVSVEAIKKQGLEKKAGEVTEILKEIETLAKHYWTLETKTKRVVRDVQSYGGYLIEAADDFTNDHDFEELLINVMNMDDVKISLQKANEEHDIVKGEADKIQVRAQSSGFKYNEKEKEMARFLIQTNIEGAAYVSTPVLGQIASFAVCGYAAASKMIEECAKNTSANNIPIKMLAGGLAGVGGAIGGLAISTIVMPASPVIWWYFLSKNIDAKYFKELAVQFQSIGNQMMEVEVHLTVITSALSDIEKHLNMALRAEKSAKRQVTDEMRARMVGRMRTRAEKLIESCETYFSNVKTEGRLAIGDNATSSIQEVKKEN